MRLPGKITLGLALAAAVILLTAGQAFADHGRSGGSRIAVSPPRHSYFLHGRGVVIGRRPLVPYFRTYGRYSPSQWHLGRFYGRHWPRYQPWRPLPGRGCYYYYRAPHRLHGATFTVYIRIK